MSVFEDIKAKYRDHRLGKMDAMARALNVLEGRVQAAPNARWRYSTE